MFHSIVGGKRSATAFQFLIAACFAVPTAASPARAVGTAEQTPCPNEWPWPPLPPYPASRDGGGSAGTFVPRISIVAGSFTLNVSGSITTP
jgi:hypothetical protein